jgi:hypothetical protein
MQTFVVWLNATSDLERLCEIACLQPDGPGWSPADMVDALGDVWIALPGEAPPPLRMFIGDGVILGITKALESQGRRSGEPYGRLLGVRFTDAHLENVFYRVFGDDAPRLAARVSEVTEHLEAPIQALREQMGAYLDKKSGPGSDTLDWIALVQSPEELGERQREAIRDLVIELDRSHVTNERRERRTATVATAEEIRRRLARLCAKRVQVLTENAWDWIRAERDVEVLSLLERLAERTDSARSFSQLRRALFENRLLCHYVVRTDWGEP